MSKLPVIKDRELVKFLEFMGFRVTRTKGSHVRLRSRRWKGNHCSCAWKQGYTKRAPA